MPSKSDRRRRNRRVALITLAVYVVALLSIPLWTNFIARLCAGQFVVWSSRFRVERTLVSGNHMVSAAEIAELAKVSKGASLFHVGTSAVKARVEKHPWIRTAVVRRRLPDTIEIQVIEREPVAAVRTDRLLMVTSDSVALAPLSDNWVWDYPLLTPSGPVKIKVGATIADRSTLALLHEALTLRSVSQTAWHDLSELYYADGQMHAALTHPAVDILLGRGASELAWAGALKILKDKNNPSLARCQTIDLRIPGKIILSEGTGAIEEQTRG